MRALANLGSTLGLAFLIACAGNPGPPPPPMPDVPDETAPEVPTTDTTESGTPATTEGANPECPSPQACFEEAEGLVGSDPARAAVLHRSACDSKYAPGCVRLGQMTFDGMGVDKDPLGAFKLFEIACGLGNGPGCGNVGVMLLKGIGVDKDETKAVPLLVKSCEAGYGEGCFNSGIVHLNGLGVKADTKIAIEMFDAACKIGHENGCKGAQQLRDEQSGAGGGVAGANVTVGEMTVDGLTIANLSCNLQGGGFFASAAAIGSLAKQKKLLNRCGKDKPVVTWSFKGGKAVDVKVEGAKPKDAKCIEGAMKQVRAELVGQCSATIVGK
jgi:hypothetical protein